MEQLNDLFNTLLLLKVELSNRGIPIVLINDLLDPFIGPIKKLIRQELAINQLFSGTSKSAMKRRSNRLNICLGCGRIRHEASCKTFSTNSQENNKHLAKYGTIRVLDETERSFPKNKCKAIEMRRVVREAKSSYNFELLKRRDAMSRLIIHQIDSSMADRPE